MFGRLILSVPDEEATLVLIERFYKLLMKYSIILGYEDAYNDLCLFFIELITKMREKPIAHKGDAAIVNYIAISVKNEYIRLSKKQKRLPLALSDLSEEQQRDIDARLASTDPEYIIDLLPHKCTLTSWEYEILIMFFVEDIPISEIAKKKNKTRQAVNQAKNRAVEKIKRATIE